MCSIIYCTLEIRKKIIVGYNTPGKKSLRITSMSTMHVRASSRKSPWGGGGVKIGFQRGGDAFNNIKNTLS